MNVKINDKEYKIVESNEKFYRAEYFTENDKRHRAEGPAMTFKQGNSYYYEWWNNGKLVATFNQADNVMKKTNNGEFSGLKEIKLNEKWKGLESSLSLNDLSRSFDLALSKDAVLGNVNALRNENKSPTSTNKAKIN